MNQHSNSARFSRRDMLQFGAGVVGTGTLTAWLGSGALGQVDSNAVTNEMKKEAKAEISPNQALKMLIDGNKRFAEGKPLTPHRSLERLKEVAPYQEPFAAVLSCADSRVLPEVLFDQGIGDIFDVRVAGNVATVEETASEEYASAVLGVKVLMVLGHERCGVLKAALAGGELPGSVGRLVEQVMPAVASSANKFGDKLANAVKANVMLQLTRLQTSPVIGKLVQEGKLKLVGGYYDLDTGVVSILIPNYLNWNLLILGTDINTESITKAKAGSYSEWSFRMVSGEVKRRYFSHEDKNWQLNEKIRRMVTFRSGNLLTDNYPSLNSDIYNMDIIICRNVFIYFNAENVETILGKFYQSLGPGGYLIVGHTELHDLNLQGFVPKAYEESVVYRRSEDMPKEIATSAATQSRIPTMLPPIAIQPKSRIQKPSPTQTFVSPLPPLPIESQTAKAKQPPVEVKPDAKQGDRLTPPSELEKVQALFERGEYVLALQRADELLRQKPNNFDVIYLIAQAYANLGQYKKAMYYCEQAITLNSMSTDVYHLLVHIAEDQSNLSLAKEYLKRIIYIDENAIAAYLDLGSIYKLEADSRRAKQMFDTAIELLNKLSPETKVEYRGKVKVAELLGQISANI